MQATQLPMMLELALSMQGRVGFQMEEFDDSNKAAALHWSDSAEYAFAPDDACPLQTSTWQ